MLRRPETQQVARFLYELLVSQAPSPDYARKVAERMGLPYPSLAKYWQGRAAFPAGMVRSLFLATDQNVRVAEFFLLDGTDYRLERKSGGGQPLDVARDLMMLSQMEGEISGLYLAATHEDSEAGRNLSYSEAKELAEALRKLGRVADDLRQVLRKMHPLT